MSSDHPAVNGHTHLYSGLAPLGMPEPARPPENFLQILERVWWRLDRALDEDTLRASARYYVAEALLAGTSTLVDHHESPSMIEGSLDILADACEELGIRALIAYGATERNGGLEEARRGLEECRRFIESNRRHGIVGAVALHASFTVSDETIQAAGELCRRLDAVMHVHLAEDRADVDDAIRRGYAGPLERLLDLDALPPGSILAHGVHLDEAQVRRASDEGLWLVQNPRSNRGNRVGYPAGLVHAERVAIGTDGYPAVMEDELAALIEEAPDHQVGPEEVRRRAAGGRRLARELFGDETDLDQAAWSNGALVSLEIAGRQVVSNGILLTGDIDSIRREAREQANRLWTAMASVRGV